MKNFEWRELVDSLLYNKIMSDWEIMLSNTKLKEQDYHNYLFENPAFFLTKTDSYLVISKLKLGMDYETDFVVVKEGYSDGTKFEIIEIESPHTNLFDKQGKPTSKFNSALQQIRDWKRFLIDNKHFFQKTFPTSTTRIISNSKISFKIIIGRRSNSQVVLEKRRQIAESENIEIISFDRITEMAKYRRYFPDTAMIHAAQMDSIPYAKKNELANPFYKCLTDSQWRRICNDGHSHFYSNMIDKILEYRTYSKHFEEFKENINLQEDRILFNEHLIDNK